MANDHKPQAENDHMARRIADCLEAHLPAFGFEPYRYPSGENKSVQMLKPAEVRLYDAHGNSWVLAISSPPGITDPSEPT